MMTVCSLQKESTVYMCVFVACCNLCYFARTVLLLIISIVALNALDHDSIVYGITGNNISIS